MVNDFALSLGWNWVAASWLTDNVMMPGENAECSKLSA
jgi:hypothetical protein